MTKINTEAKFIAAAEKNPANERALAVEAYKAIRSRSEARSAEIFDEAVVTYLAKRNLPSTPRNCVRAAADVSFKCGRCAGTGQFVTMVLNGRPTGPGGICFRCEGKGEQNDSDCRRNYIADIKRPVYI